MPELVSILIPLFGRHRGAQTLAAVCAAWSRQDVPCEVVVAVAGDAPMAPAGVVRVVEVDPAVSSPGVLRNRAAERAVGDWLYLSDADVRPVGTDYLARACRLAGAGVLAQPWMFRWIGAAPIDAAPIDAAPIDAAADLAWDDELRRLSVLRCCFVQASEDSAPRACADERYGWQDETLMVRPPPVLPVADDELRWRPPFHWGGMLLPRDLFGSVGGYCADYVGWGCEDDDLLTKVGAHATVITAWQADPTLRCVHYEHPRPYDNAVFALNRARLARRLVGGVEAMVEADLGRYPVPNEE